MYCIRPTVHYAYHPCDDAVMSIHELAGKNWNPQTRQRIMMDDVVSGVDELGVLLGGHEKGAHDSCALSIHLCCQARTGMDRSWVSTRQECWSHPTTPQAYKSLLLPLQELYGLCETQGLLLSLWLALTHTVFSRGIVEPEQMDHKEVLDIINPYMRPVVGAYTDWNPLHQRETLFVEDLDHSDPWQFKNVRIV